MSMKPDYCAFLAQQAYRKGFQGIDYNDIDAVTVRYHVLVATEHKEDKDTGGNALRSEWAKGRQKVDLGKLPDFLAPPLIDLSQLPFGSFFIQFTFKLLKPYISRDDNQFYIVDNPIVRDKVFRLPMVRPTAWKGSLRHALWQLGHQKENEQIKRLFGTANEDQPDEGNSGRLYFYPSFFTQTSLEIINPHDRERRVGKNPILIESVPIGADATFTLLYTPLDRIGKDEAETRRQEAEDLTLLAQGLHDMFTRYGFGAKTSSGFGLARDGVNDARIKTNVLEAMQLAPRPAEPAMPEVLRGFLEAFPNEDFSLKPNEWRKRRGATSSQRKQYMEARSAFREYQEAQEAYRTALAEWKTQAEEPVQHFLEDEFKSFSGLAEEVAGNLAERLTAGGDA